MLKTKLGKRLLEIFQLVEDNYNSVWDLCCDHGKLGLALFEGNKCHRVHFVDQVPEITKNLQDYLDKIPNLDKSLFSIMTMDAGDISPSDGDLVCICGVGGDVAITIMNKILSQNDCSNITFLISAQYQLFELRKFLNEKGFGQIKSKLVFEGKWGYELLLVRLGEDLKIDIIGEDLFDSNNSQSVHYFKNLYNHYERKSRSDQEVKIILDHYKDLLIRKNLK